jgi:hypothetical protein
MPLKQEIACQQVLMEDSSVFSIQWSIFPHRIGDSLTPQILMQRYLEYIRRFTATIIRPAVDSQGVEFRLLSSRISLISFQQPANQQNGASQTTTLYICGGILVQPHECDRGELRFGIERLDNGIKVSLQLSDFCPLLLGSSSPSIIRRWLYRLTQALIHRIVTIRFLALLYHDLAGENVPHRVVKVKVRDGKAT